MNDDLESRLRRAAETLDAAAERREPATTSRVEHSGVSRRRLVTTAAAAIVAGVVAVAAVAHRDESPSPAATAPVGTSTAATEPPTPVTEAVTTTTDPPLPNQLETALEALGVDVEAAPPGATRLGAEFCGVDREDSSQPRLEPQIDAQRCLVDRCEAGERAIAVTEWITPEGDPVITIYRADPDGEVEVYTDMTRDAFGSGEWEFGACDGVTFAERGLRLRGC